MSKRKVFKVYLNTIVTSLRTKATTAVEVLEKDDRITETEGVTTTNIKMLLKLKMRMFKLYSLLCRTGYRSIITTTILSTVLWLKSSFKAGLQ